MLSRYGFGAIAWFGTWLFTQSLTLAGLMRREFIRDDFRLAFRRAGWFARHIFPALDFFEDPFFDFTMETNARQRRRLERFVRRYKSGLNRSAYLTDLLYIQAANLHGAIEEHSEGYYSHEDVVAFYDNADLVLFNLATPPEAGESGLEDRKEDFSKEDARTALCDFAEALPLDRWPWYVVSGTFLGLHRDGGFLAHDYDIDVGINAEEISIPDLIKVLERQPMFVTKKVDEHIEIVQDDGGSLHLTRVPALVKLVHSNGLNLDVFIHHTEQGACWHGSIIHRWENKPFDLAKRELEGVPVYAPADADQYLTENYGDWKTPVKDFDCTTGTPNLVVSRNFLSVALFLKRLAVFSESDGKQAEKLRRTLISAEVITENGGVLTVVRSFQSNNKVQGAA